MKCYIYRSSIKEGLYVYLADENGLEKLPPPVMKQLGTPEFSMTIDLHPEKQLGQEDARKVLDNLASQGFHIQMPREIEHQLEAIARSAQRTRQ